MLSPRIPTAPCVPVPVMLIRQHPQGNERQPTVTSMTTEECDDTMRAKPGEAGLCWAKADPLKKVEREKDKEDDSPDDVRLDIWGNTVRVIPVATQESEPSVKTREEVEEAQKQEEEKRRRQEEAKSARQQARREFYEKLRKRDEQERNLRQMLKETKRLEKEEKALEEEQKKQVEELKRRSKIISENRQGRAKAISLARQTERTMQLIRKNELMQVQIATTMEIPRLTKKKRKRSEPRSDCLSSQQAVTPWTKVSW